MQKISKEAPQFLTNPQNTWLVGLLMWSVEVVLNLYVINRVKFTEIDWKAYMQEVEGFINGTHDYMQLKGDTGPLVYPAGFVYVYTALYYMTSHGTNVKLGQYIFFLIYLVNLYFVIQIYSKTKKCPPYVIIFMCCTSYRVHSIFVLRLFNDPIAMFGCFTSLSISSWTKIIALYYSNLSFAVSIKMNILLFSPGLLVLLLLENGILKTFLNLTVCAALQVILAIPFLLTNPFGYIVRSFDLSRQFFFVWTVNWRLIPEELFLDRRFHFALLLCHLAVLIAFALKRWSFETIINMFKCILNGKTYHGVVNVIALAMFTSNFIGICFSRSLHYQFYVWYYHTLPFLLWCTPFSSPARLLLFGLIEMCWNTYPSTFLSSLGLHICHICLLLGLWVNKSTAL
uniref:dolichyl-P-Man:Man5GlcNAc2-PP-dolichol alpha-1,3-mannosyltransferase n=1 Tax=Ciona savignyi TaxID=51511 RepID=H2YCK2_CIOSA